MVCKPVRAASPQRAYDSSPTSEKHSSWPRSLRYPLQKAITSQSVASEIDPQPTVSFTVTDIQRM